MNKNELRKKYLDIRKNIKDKADQSISITNELIRKNYFVNAETVALYSSREDEVNTTMLINMCILLGKNLCLPKILDDNTIEFYYITDDEDLTPGKMNILEPNTNDLVNINDIDLMILPGICFDKNYNRIGTGKGYYDRYLSRPHHFRKVALSFNEQYIDEIIDAEPTDIKIDEVIYPRK